MILLGSLLIFDGIFTLTSIPFCKGIIYIIGGGIIIKSILMKSIYKYRGYNIIVWIEDKLNYLFTYIILKNNNFIAKLNGVSTCEIVIENAEKYIDELEKDILKIKGDD